MRPPTLSTTSGMSHHSHRHPHNHHHHHHHHQRAHHHLQFPYGVIGAPQWHAHRHMYAYGYQPFPAMPMHMSVAPVLSNNQVPVVPQTVLLGSSLPTTATNTTNNNNSSSGGNTGFLLPTPVQTPAPNGQLYRTTSLMAFPSQPQQPYPGMLGQSVSYMMAPVVVASGLPVVQAQKDEGKKTQDELMDDATSAIENMVIVPTKEIRVDAMEQQQHQQQSVPMPIGVRTSKVVEDVSDDEETGDPILPQETKGDDDEFSGQNSIVFLHFNDVYELEPRKTDPVGGLARFLAKIRTYQHADPLVVFSGDAFSPSMLSTDTRGRHMVDALNMLNITTAVYGNHDFDHGVQVLHKLAAKCNFPWLMSNCLNADTKRPLGGGKVKHIIEHKGRKIGFIGLIERDWIDALATVDDDDVIFTDFCEAGSKLVDELKNEDKVDLVVAVTHMRHVNDERLAREVPDIDMILCGHDHDYKARAIGDVWVVNSGCDFREFTKLTVRFRDGARPTIFSERFEVNSTDPVDPDADLFVKKLARKSADMMNKVIGHIGCDFEARFSELRTKETNMGNLVADVFRDALNADIALVNGGTLRADTVFKKGPFTLRNLRRMMPFLDTLTLVELNGAQLIKVLENGVSKYPELEGRFLQTSGLKFRFDPKKAPGSRVVRSSVMSNGELVKSSRKYKVVTTSFLAGGHDGFDAFLEGRVLVAGEDGISMCTAMRNFFKMQRALKKWSCYTDTKAKEKLLESESTILARAIDKFRKRDEVFDDKHSFAVVRTVEGRITQV